MKWRLLQDSIDILDSRGEIDPDLDISNVIHNSLYVKENGLFVAIEGTITDGHKYIGSAKEKGARVAIVEKFVDEDIFQVKVENSRIALACLANCFYGYPSKKMKIIGITATNGKTTTSFMLERVLLDAGYKVGVIGTVEIKYGDKVIPSELTTPESVDLQKYLSDMYAAGVEIVIMEVSSSAQELFRNYGVDYDIVTFNNISEEHIEQHGSFEAYFSAKSKLIREAEEETAVILNIDYPEIRDLVNKTKGQVFTISSGSDLQADVFVEDLDLSTGKGRFLCTTKGKEKKDWKLLEDQFSVKLNVSGYSSVLNSLVVIAIGKILNISNDSLQKSLESFTGVERRFELIYDHDFKILDDHFANSKNIEVTMSTLEKMDYKNLHIVYAIRGNRGVELNYKNALDLIGWAKKLNVSNLLVTKSLDTTSKKDLVLEEEEKSCQRAFNENNIEYNLRENLEETINEIMPKLEEGDVLLLAGCQGMDKGARFVWDYLLQNGPSKYSSEIREKIEKRVC